MRKVIKYALGTIIIATVMGNSCKSVHADTTTLEQQAQITTMQWVVNQYYGGNTTLAKQDPNFEIYYNRDYPTVLNNLTQQAASLVVTNTPRTENDTIERRDDIFMMARTLEIITQVDNTTRTFASFVSTRNTAEQNKTLTINCMNGIKQTKPLVANAIAYCNSNPTYAGFLPTLNNLYSTMKDYNVYSVNNNSYKSVAADMIKVINAKEAFSNYCIKEIATW